MKTSPYTEQNGGVCNFQFIDLCVFMVRKQTHGNVKRVELFRKSKHHYSLSTPLVVSLCTVSRNRVVSTQPLTLYATRFFFYRNSRLRRETLLVVFHAYTTILNVLKSFLIIESRKP